MIILNNLGEDKQKTIEALHCKNGSRQVRFRYELIANGVKKSYIDVDKCTISLNSTNQISRIASFELFDNNNSINWINDLIKPIMQVKVNDLWIDFPLGLFIPSSPTKNGNIYSVEAYDKTVILKEDCIINRLFMKIGTNYIDAIKDLILSTSETDILFENCETLLPTDREYEIGTSKLEIINNLLSEINYRNLFVDATGFYVLKKYIEPNANNITYTYKANEYSVLYPNTTIIEDFYNVPNIFIAVCSNVELTQDYKSIFINDNPLSQLSTINRKRKIISEIYRPDVINSQVDLDIFIRRIAFEKSQVFETTTITTTLMPIHDHHEVLELYKDDIKGIYSEISWSMDLSVGGKMTHNIRRLSQI